MGSKLTQMAFVPANGEQAGKEPREDARGRGVPNTGGRWARAVQALLLPRERTAGTAAPAQTTPSF